MLEYMCKPQNECTIQAFLEVIANSTDNKKAVSIWPLSVYYIVVDSA